MRFLFLILSIQVQAQVCTTDWFCTNGGGKTIIVPYSDLSQDNFYTVHHIDFGDGSDTSFIGEYNPIAIGYQAIVHTYDFGVHIATLTTSFYDSTTNALLCTKTKQDSICSPSLTYINETKTSLIDNKMYDFLGRELKKIPKNQPYIKNNNIYINKF